MSNRLYIRDTNGTGLWHNVSDWIDAWPIDLQQQTSGVISTLSVQMSSHRQGVAAPIVPLNGMEYMLYDHDGNGAGQHIYYMAGLLRVFDRDPTLQGSGYVLKIAGPERLLRTHIAHIEFDEATYPTDSSRVTRLFEVATAQYGLPGTWDASTQVAAGGFVTYPTGSRTPYHRRNVAQILDELRADPGQDPDNPVPVREMYLRGVWNDPLNIPDSGITWYVHYYSATSVQQELVPLTDRPDKMADYVSDEFTRANSTTSMGAADTSQSWSSMVGTFGIDLNKAFLATSAGGGAHHAAVVNAGAFDGEFEVTFSVKQTLQRAWFRVLPEPAQVYKYSGLMVQNEAGAGYSLFKYEGGVFTQLGSTFAATPADGDVIKVVLAGTSVKVYLNGALIITQTSNLNTTSTHVGIGLQGIGAGAARWDNLSFRAVAALHGELKQVVDDTNAKNIQPIAGPGSDPTPVKWASATGVSGAEDGSLTKTLAPAAWAAASAVSTGDRRRPTKPNGRHYKLTSAGGTTGGAEPPWNLTEGGTTTDNGLVWTTEMWDTGTVSTHVISTDGGYAAAQVEETWKVSDHFERADNTAILGQTESQQNWELTAVSGTPIWGVESNYARSITAIESFAVVESGVSTCIVQVELPVATNGARLVARYQDAQNLWFIEAGATTFKLYKRVAGANTEVGSVTLTPMAGDILKLVLSDQTIQFYHARAGLAPSHQFTVTGQAHNEGATKHGMGVTSSASAARFNNFEVWQTYSQDVFGLTDASTGVISPAQVDFGWLRKADRSIVVCESGTERAGTNLTYTVGDSFKVEVRPVSVGGGVIEPVVKYYRRAASDTIWIEHYISTVTPTLTEASPLRVAGAIYHAGATIAGVTMRRFTYGVYAATGDFAPDGIFGPYPAPDMIQDDTLDSEAKRKARANAVFARHPVLETVTCETLQEYTAGRTLLLNVTKFPGWENRRMFIAHVKPQWDKTRGVSKYILTLGNRRREYSDKEALGYLITGLPPTGEGPDRPTGFTYGAGTPDGYGTVQQEFSWDTSQEGVQYIWIEVQRVGGQVLRRERALAGETPYIMHGLLPSVPCIARAQAQDYNGRPSYWTSGVQFRTADLGLPAAPTGVTVSSEGILHGVPWLLLSFTHSAYTRRSGYRLFYYPSALPPGIDAPVQRNPPMWIPPDQNYVRVSGQAPGVEYEYVLATLNETGIEGPRTTPLAHTITALPPKEDPPPSFTDGHPDSALAGWVAGSAHTSVIAATRTTTGAWGGQYVMQLLTAFGVAEYISPKAPAEPGEEYIAGSANKIITGASVGSTAEHYIDWLDASSALLSSSTVYSAVAATAWPVSGMLTEAKVTAPASTKYARHRYKVTGVARVVLFSDPKLERVVWNPKQLGLLTSVGEPIELRGADGVVRGDVYISGTPPYNIVIIGRNVAGVQSGFYFSSASGDMLQFSEGNATISTPGILTISAAGGITLNAAPPLDVLGVQVFS